MCQNLPNPIQDGCLALLSDKMQTAQASLAAEWLGHFGNTEVVTEPLLAAVMHESALVREGVRLGLEAIIERQRHTIEELVHN